MTTATIRPSGSANARPVRLAPTRNVSGVPSAVDPGHRREVAGRAEQEPQAARRPRPNANDAVAADQVGPIRGSSPAKAKTVRRLSQRDDHASRHDDQPSTTNRFCSSAGIVRAERRDADRRLDDEERDPGRRDPGSQREEPADPCIVGAEMEDAPARPEPGHQADDAGDRREERGRRAAAARDRQDRPDEVGQEPGQGAGPRPGERADEDGPDRVEVDRQAQGEDERADRDVDRDRDRPSASDVAVVKSRDAARRRSRAGSRRRRGRQVGQLDRRDAVRRLPFGADRQPAQAHAGTSCASGPAVPDGTRWRSHACQRATFDRRSPALRRAR